MFKNISQIFIVFKIKYTLIQLPVKKFFKKSIFIVTSNIDDIYEFIDNEKPDIVIMMFNSGMLGTNEVFDFHEKGN